MKKQAFTGVCTIKTGIVQMPANACTLTDIVLQMTDIVQQMTDFSGYKN